MTEKKNNKNGKNGNGNGLTKQQIKYAKAVYDGTPTQQVMAKQLGVSDRTLRRWKEKPEFLELIDGWANETLADAKRMLKKVGAMRAVVALLSILGSHTEEINGKTVLVLDYGDELDTVRRAASDVLEATELKQEAGALSLKIIDSELKAPTKA